MSKTSQGSSEADASRATTSRELKIARIRRWNTSEKANRARIKWRRKNPKRTWVHGAVSSAKARSKKRGIEFNLDTKHVYAITSTHCPVFGLEFLFGGNKNIRPASPSMDRLDPSKGYIKGNVVVISMKANMIKNAYSSKDIAAVATWLASYGL